jgi:hypothetical protein
MTYYFGTDAMWIKVAGFMFWAKRSPPLFSERYSYEKFIRLPLTNWRFQCKRLINQHTKGATKQ